MAVIGRTFRPAIDTKRCNTCSICAQQCPAYADEGFRQADKSVRGKVFRSFDSQPPPRVTPIEAVTPPCQAGCPIGQDVRGYLKAVAEKRHADAVALIRQTNPLPLVCGTICPHPCESGCLRGAIEEPVAIRAVKRFAALFEKRNQLIPRVPDPIPGKRVAIIGAGPAGIAAAYTLARRGVTPVIFEKTPRPGGMLAWAIPDFRLPRHILDYEMEVLASLGITFRLSRALGTDFTIQTLEDEGFDAVVLAIGTTQGQKIPLDGGKAFENHLDCLAYLFTLHKGQAPDLGDAVAVVGGGNAAIDTARVLKRLGVPEVTVVYRRPRAQMPADREEVQAAEREGVRFFFSALPTRLSRGNGRWHLGGFQTRSAERGAPVEVLKNTPFDLPVTGVISAIRQVPETHWADTEDITVNPDGTLRVDDAQRTSREGVYAAGDAVTGPTTVVEAMASGAAAARAILDDILGEQTT